MMISDDHYTYCSMKNYVVSIFHFSINHIATCHTFFISNSTYEATSSNHECCYLSTVT